MKVTFLSAAVPLTKTYIFEQGNIDSTPYPLAKNFSSHEEHVNSLEELYAQIVDHGQYGHCMLKGHLIRNISMEPRAGLMASEQTLLLVLDFDGLDPQERSIDDILSAIGLSDVSYIIQYSASQGIKKGLNAHVFMILDRPWSAGILKEWLKWKNLSVGFLHDQLSLTKTGMALHWPLDITLAQNDKLIYIAPPRIIGRDDPCPKRIELVNKSIDKASLALPPVGLDEQVKDVLRQLRASAGYADHKLDVKYIKKYDAEILRNPDRASVTGVKRQDTFTYLNLNGGDSWAYYHMTENPVVLHNFKGEPGYLLEELAPEYYKEAQQYAKLLRKEAHIPEDSDTKTQYFVINERSQGKYWKVEYDPVKGVSLYPAPSLKHVADFCMLHGLAMPEPVLDWDIEFNPTSLNSIDIKNRKINTFVPTIYKLRSKRQENLFIEPYRLLFTHVLGGCETSFERFINWLAFIWQTGKRPETAWLFHGTFGTGKGTVAHVLRKLFGKHYVEVTADGLADKFNEHLATAQILFLDEVSTDAWDTKKANMILKSLIAGAFSVRAMRTAWNTEVQPYFGLIAAANEFNPVEIQLGDRRWNVPPRQEVPIRQVEWFSAELVDKHGGVLFEDDQLQTLADYLTSYQVDVGKVMVPMDTEAKRFVMNVTQNIQSDIAQALQTGNAEFFVGFAKPVDGMSSMDDAEYRQVVGKIMEGGYVVFTVPELKIIFSYLAGWNQAKLKFDKALQHAGIDIKTVRNGQSTMRGCKFRFVVSDIAQQMWAQINQQSTLRVVREAVND